jgi:2-succinyl-6-hydroxy-2,4-cyclohexadiene-1-carboxylate synthase
MRARQDSASGSGPPPGRLHAEKTGKGERVVLVHGFTQTGRSWAPVGALLAEGHEVVTLDLPGHGRSVDVEVDDLGDAARLAAATGGRACYVGYSLGGRVCLELALDHPHLVTALVLVSATAGIEDAEERAARRRGDDQLADRLDPPGSRGGLEMERFISEWLAQPLFGRLAAGDAGVSARLENTPGGLAASLRTTGTGTMAPLWERLGELAMPTLVVAGAEDHKFAALASRLARAIGANAELALVPSAGHAIPFESPAEFARLVTGFLAKP